MVRKRVQYCPKCGRELKDDPAIAYCPYCGAQLRFVYAQATNAPRARVYPYGFWQITYPYQQYVFPLGLLGVLALVVGIAGLALRANQKK
jgi:predicted amidophosphoribosyltransferase